MKIIIVHCSSISILGLFNSIAIYVIVKACHHLFSFSFEHFQTFIWIYLFMLVFHIPIQFRFDVIQYFNVAPKTHKTMNHGMDSCAQHSQWTIILRGEGRRWEKRQGGGCERVEQKMQNNHWVCNMKIIAMHTCVFQCLWHTGSAENKIRKLCDSIGNVNQHSLMLCALCAVCRLL